MIFTIHTFKSSGIIFLVTFFMVHCQTPVKNKAKDTIYYLELIDSSSDQRYQVEFLNEVEGHIQGKKYAITNSSESSWPFYQEFDPNTPVPKDSLTPPHVVTHLFPKKDVEDALEGDFRVTVIFRDPQLDQINFDLYNYKKTGEEWILVANTGNHSLTANKLRNSTPSETASRIIIRYSFK